MVTDFSKLKVNLNFKIKVKHKTRAPAAKQDKVLTKSIETKCRYDNGKFYVVIPNCVYKHKLKSGVDVNDIGTKDIIAVRHAGIDFILNVCDKLEKENDYILQYLLRGG